MKKVFQSIRLWSNLILLKFIKRMGVKMRSKRFIKLSFIIMLVIFINTNIFSNNEEFKVESFLKSFVFRGLGPYRCGSWVTGFAVPEKPLKAHLYTFYVATRNGGVWKTTNNGTTFEPIFDEQRYLSIGAIALAPSNPEVVWVGTGEAYNARSSNRGNGVYKSEDGGKTWKHMGLEDTHHIAKIIIHPENPDIVYVAAMGHLFTPNKERGLFKTTDGGKTWKKILYVNESTGVIDLVINPLNPDILYAATYEMMRRPWELKRGGPGSGIYKTTDGGRTWQKLTNGLPSGKVGRIGIDIYLKNPNILYAIVENLNKGTPFGEVYRTDDAGRTWRRVSPPEINLSEKAPYSFNQIRIDPTDDKKIYVLGITLANSTDGGKTWHDVKWPPKRLFSKAFGDVRTLWIDPLNPDRIFFGSDGGVFISYDGGKTCDHYYNLPLGEFYAVGVDMDEPYNIYGGLQDHDSWKGPSNGWSGRITISDWVTVGIQDGMYNQVDPICSRWLYNTFQFGGHRRVDQRLGVAKNIMPKREKGKEPYRFNWTPPLIISPHNSSIIYTGAQVLLRSLDRGEHWEEISPDLTTNDREKIKAGGREIHYCTITTISESPLKPGLIWVGTDDGKVWITKNGGVDWIDLTENLTKAGAPINYNVSRVFASYHNPGTAYVTKSGFKWDDFKPFVFKTTDYGKTWISISNNLPEFPVNVIIEDRKNPNLLFVGTDSGLYVSINGGKKWFPMKNNLPWVKITDLIIHPRDNDLIVATYGRGLFITDITPLQQLNEEILEKEIYFFDIESKNQYVTRGWGNYHLYGDRHIFTPNEPNAIVINYYLRDKTSKEVKIIIKNLYGEIVKELTGKGERGLNTVLWNMRGKNNELVEPGVYQIILKIGEKVFTKKAMIRKRIAWEIGPRTITIK